MRRRATAFLAIVSVVSLAALAPGGEVVAAEVTGATASKIPDLPKVEPVPVRPLPEAVGRPKMDLAPSGELAADLPDAGSSEVDLSGSWSEASGLPVEVRQLGAVEPTTEGAAAEGADSAAGVVSLVPAPGGDQNGFLVSVAGTETPPTAASDGGGARTSSDDSDDSGDVGTEGVPARVRVSYARFSQAFGGAWAERLGVVIRPACFAETPELAECSTGVRIPVENDLAAQTLTYSFPTSMAQAAVLAGLDDTSAASIVARSSTALAETSTETGAGSKGSGSDAGSAGAAGVGRPEGPETTAQVAGTESNYVSTPLSQTGQWQTGEGSGEFSYSYPFALPPASGGATPALALQYSSGSVDGMTTSRNSQSSEVGIGWSSLSPGSITRSFEYCFNDATVSNSQCWNTENGHVVEDLVLTLNGKTSPLIHTQRKVNGAIQRGNEYRMLDDPGWRVEKFSTSNPPAGTAPSNTDNDSEAFRVTTQDGTQYWFGWGKAANGATDNSVWTVPVVGNDPGEPCYQSGQQVTNSFCQQAWQWNLDRVVDPSGNEIRYGYEREVNRYSLFSSTSSLLNVAYDRAGELTSVQYGFDRATGVPRQQVNLEYKYRCGAAMGDTTAACAAPAPSDPGDFPDVPTDSICTSTSFCGQAAPTYFTTKMLDKVSTTVAGGTGASPRLVDVYRIVHALPDQNAAGCCSSNALRDPIDLYLYWVAHTGYSSTGQATANPVTYFFGTALQNRVNQFSTGVAARAYSKWRVNLIINELGGRVNVTYGHADGQACTPVSVQNAPIYAAPGECFSQYFIQPGASSVTKAWFHKYVVRRIALTDDALGIVLDQPQPAASTTSLGSSQFYYYDYVGAPAWRYVAPQNGFVDRTPGTGYDGDFTWSDWRGYEKTIIHTPRVVNQQVLKDSSGVPLDLARRSVVRFRGMDNAIKNTAGDTVGERRVTLSEPVTGGGDRDFPWLEGLVAEEETFDPPRNAWIDRTFHGYNTLFTGFDSNRSDGKLARIVNENITRTHTRLTLPGPLAERLHVINYQINAGAVVDNGNTRTEEDRNKSYLDPIAGSIAAVVDHGFADTVAGDKYCTLNTYVTDASRWMRLPSATVSNSTDADTCPTPTSGADASSQVFYDGDTTGTPSLTRGLPTMMRTVATSATGTANLDALMTYDAYGRVTGTRTPRGEWTYTDYNPGGNVNDLITRIDTRAPLTMNSSSTLDPGHGSTLTSSDPNQNTTTLAYDGLGRLTTVRLPGNTTGTPSMSMAYDIGLARPSKVTTTTQRAGATTDSTYAYLDGWGRTIETQVPQATDLTKRVVSATGYDERGLVRYTMPTVVNNAAPGSGLVNPAPATQRRYTTETTYDAASRPVYTTESSLGVVRTQTSNSYYGDRVATVNPVGGLTYRSYTPSGQLAAVEQQTGTVVNGVPETISSRYTYNARGLTKTIDGQTGGTAQQWNYTYDSAGRRMTAVDPDSGTSVSTYDLNGNQLTIDDAGPQGPVATAYDALDRPITRTAPDGTGPGNLSDTWTYDTAPGGKGLLASTTTYTQIGTQPLPSPTYASASTSTGGYDPRGNPLSMTRSFTRPAPIAGALGAMATDQVTETYTYNDADDPTSISYSKIANLDAQTLTYTYGPAGLPATITTSDNTSLANYGYENTNEAYKIDSAYDTSTPDNGLKRLYGRNVETGWLAVIYGATGTDFANPDLGLATTYDAIGQPTRISGVQYRANGATQSGAWCFTYDRADRLTNAFTGNNDSNNGCVHSNTANPDYTAVTGQNYNLTYTYTGDRLNTVTGTDTNGTHTATYAYTSPGHPHATSTITTTPGATSFAVPTTNTLNYDTAGRATTIAEQAGPTGTYTYDAQGQHTSTTEGLTETTNGYDANSIRVARRTNLPGTGGIASTMTVYLGDTELEYVATLVDGLIQTSPNPTLTAKRHYTSAGDTPLAVQENTTPAALPDTPDRWTFLLADQQDTVRLTRSKTKGSTNPLDITTARYNYAPYGDPTTPAAPTTGSTAAGRSYLNKVIDLNGDVRLDHRTYQPNLNTLTTPDPVLIPGDPQTLNPYAYAGNNPIAASDPSGLVTAGDGGSVAGDLLNCGSPGGMACPASRTVHNPTVGDVGRAVANLVGGVAEGTADVGDLLTPTGVAATAANNSPLPDIYTPADDDRDALYRALGLDPDSSPFAVGEVIAPVPGAGVVAGASKITVRGLKVAREAKATTRVAGDVFEHGYTYHPRIRQRGLEDPRGHNFPYSFDDVILRERPITQTDGSQLYRKLGEVNGKVRIYEIALNPNSGVIFHRTITKAP